MIVKLKDVRIAFCQNLFKAGSLNDGEPRFSSTFLIPKDDAQVKMVKQTILDVAREKWADKAETVLRSLYADNKVCLKDGDIKSEYEGFTDCMFIAANSKNAPKVFDRDRTELAETSGRPYAGCYVNASIEIWAQANNFGKRVNAKLRGVQFVRDGDAFAGGAPATADEFDDLSDVGDDVGDLV